ncbi:MAG TPA: DUF2147 domain-containing protein [Casimicrobiaceae bacterium]|nr:DUF2147 domain-containing protein [Casimicrobiaceae bacterium]
MAWVAAASRTRRSILAAIGAFHLATAAADPATIAGRWITFDSDSGQGRAVVEIVREGPRATGRITELFLRQGEDPAPNCERCTGADQGRPIVGLTILVLEAEADGRGFHGTVLDPEEGRTYRCKVTLTPDGRELRLRGFAGFEIFGRTETWLRAD